MHKKIRWITETGVMLALLVGLQAVTKPAGQLVTGSFVNAILAVTALVAGLSGGLAVGLISPVVAYLLGIAPQILTVPAIMAGNAVYVIVLRCVVRDGKNIVRTVAGWLGAAVVKFGVLYAIVVGLICGVFSEALVASGAVKMPMKAALIATFSWPQLVTALIGGGIALLIAPGLRKALHKA